MVIKYSINIYEMRVSRIATKFKLLIILVLVCLAIWNIYMTAWHSHKWKLNTTPSNQMQINRKAHVRNHRDSWKTRYQFKHRNIRDGTVHQYQAMCNKGKMVLSQLSYKLYQLIDTTMNPKDCSNARYLLCEWPFLGGLGSLIHQISYCFSIAVATRRVLLLKIKYNLYPESWEHYLLQPSVKCWDFQIRNYTDWFQMENGVESDVQVVRLLLTDDIEIRTNRTWPKPIPEKFIDSSAFKDKIAQHHQSPALWGIGQLMAYFFQPSPSYSQRLDDIKKAIGFTHPIIGVHIRRGDKAFEAEPTPTYKYIEAIESYMIQMGYRTSSRKLPSIFIASDERDLIFEISNQYTQYNFISTPDVFSKKHLDLIIFDILLLKECDYFIGTFSSNVGRLVYELQQSRYEDASCLAKSLDHHYRTIYCCGITQVEMKYFEFQPTCSFQTTKQQYDLIESCNNVSEFDP
ncbi:unnamed protein product [Owenia fusiformis]|uniref:Uncharacterized protein n=1 Tax=Owenia fusiformis TaxID=6347 RepID=A0A8J1U569_OWEFU|nr:unnamed protein product [Owenia fusiformis]